MLELIKNRWKIVLKITGNIISSSLVSFPLSVSLLLKCVSIGFPFEIRRYWLCLFFQIYLSWNDMPCLGIQNLVTQIQKYFNECLPSIIRNIDLYSSTDKHVKNIFDPNSILLHDFVFTILCIICCFCMTLHLQCVMFGIDAQIQI